MLLHDFFNSKERRNDVNAKEEEWFRNYLCPMLLQCYVICPNYSFVLEMIESFLLSSQNSFAYLFLTPETHPRKNKVL